MGSKMTSFNFDESMLSEFKNLANREGKSMKDLLEDYMENYIKIHKNGNPQHLIDNFIDNVDFVGFPAIALDIKNKKKHLEKMDKEMADKLYWHIQEWSTILNKQ